MNGWIFDDYFAPLQAPIALPQFIERSREIVAKSAIESHPFFSLARENPSALNEWTKQECVITNHFSLALLAMMASITNVHVRSLLMPVVAGEHSPIRHGRAYGSHPNLLAKLVTDLKIDPASITPLPFTATFVSQLFATGRSLPFWLGVLGVGNEALLVPEYGAVRVAFGFHHPSKVYRPFLTANIEEDSQHSALIEEAAACICVTEASKEGFLLGARRGVEARMSYYDALECHIRLL